jgi:hypothetical protein
MSTYSPVQYRGDGVSTDFIVPWPYASQSSVAVTVDGVSTPISSWVSPSRIRLGSAPIDGAVVLVTRPAIAIQDDSQHPDMLEVGPVSATSAAVLFSQDVSAYRSVAVQITSAGTGCTVTYEASNDGVTWTAVAGYTPSSTGSGATAPQTTSSSALLLVFPCVARYFRARVSTYTSGTVTAIAEFRTDTLAPVGINVGNTVAVAFTGTTAPTSAATGAMTKARVKAAATTNATSVKAAAGRLYELHVGNASAAIKYLKLYNKATAPTVGTDTPAATYPIPANGGRVDIVSINGISFATGIAYAITGAVGDADATAVAVDDVTGELLYV